MTGRGGARAGRGRSASVAGAGAVAWAIAAASPSAAAPASAPASPAASASATATPPLLQAVLDGLGAVAPRGAATPGGGPEAGLFARYAQAHPASPAVRPKAAATDRLVPALGWAMEQLDPASFAVLRPLPVGGAGVTLRTGDVFVLQFSTNLPGQVRLENIDPAGRRADLGTYTVLVDQLNRLPREQGIQLRGEPGVERLLFHFTPCLPREAAGQPWAEALRSRLGPCPPLPQRPGAATQAVQAARTFGTVTPRTLVNLAQPDPHVAFAAAADYRPGDSTLMETRIRHVARADPTPESPRSEPRTDTREPARTHGR